MIKTIAVLTAVVLLAACGDSDPATGERRTGAIEATAPDAVQPTGVDEAAAPSWPPAPAPGALRVATFNVSFYRDEPGQLLAAIREGNDAQIEAVAEIIRRIDPDVLLLNEIDWDPDTAAAAAFRDAYLGQDTYPYIYVPRTNTGLSSGVDLDNDGEAVTEPGTRGYGNDAFGYGVYEGQYGMAVLSKRRIMADRIRTFQTFKWRDMPDNLMPTSYYSEDAQRVFRLSSKNMIDVPVLWEGAALHIVAAHPTPPGFDGPEDRNGKRNHDEIRLIADYVTPGRGDYIYGDKGARGGLAAGERFVVMGDLNADPADGDSADNAISMLTGNPAIRDPHPSSAGAVAAAAEQGGANLRQNGPHAEDTADFRDDREDSPGNLRIDYVLPSSTGLQVVGSGVFWPAPDAPGYDLVGNGYPVISSDHRAVWVDLMLDGQDG